MDGEERAAENGRRTVRTLLADDVELVRRVVRGVLGSIEGIDVIAEAHDGLDAVRQARELRPELVLLDIQMPRMGGLAAAKEIKGLPNPPRVVMLSLHDGAAFAKASREAGADGFCDKAHMDTALPAVLGKLFPSLAL